MQFDHSKRTRLISGLAMASLLLATAACGSPAASSDPATGGSSPSSKGVIKIGTDPTYAPYEYKEGGEYVGLELDLAKAIGKEIGKEIVFEDVKYTVRGDALKAKRFDATMTGVTDTAAIRNEFLAVDEFKSLQGLIVPSGNPNGFKKIADLCGHPVAIFANVPAVSEPLKEASEKCGDKPIQIVSLADANGPYAAVQSGRADAFLGDYVQSVVQAKQMGADAIEVPDGPTDVIAFLLRKEDTALATEMACGLQKVVDSGEAAKIAAKYGISDSILLDKITLNKGERPLNCG